MPMRFQIVSDLHLEFHPDGGRGLLASIDFEVADALLVAGDLCSSKSIASSLELLCDACPKPILYIPGNHEYYGSSFANVDALLSSLEHAHPQLTVLNNRAVSLGGQRILGTPLWFPDQPGNKGYEGMLNDFRLIRGFRRDVYGAHAKALQFLEGELRQGDVVVTHHLPSLKSISPRFQSSPLNRYFASPLDTLILERQPALWLHGHTHDSTDYLLGRTRVVCNPYGYLEHELNGEWDAAKVVEV